MEKAKEQEVLLEQSAKELSERQEREKQLQKLIEEKEVWHNRCMAVISDSYTGYLSILLVMQNL